MGKGKPSATQSIVTDRTSRSTEAASIPSGLRPRREFTPSDPDGKLVILFSRIDLHGPWCLTKISRADHVTLLERVKGFESMTVHQVFSGDGKVGKDYDISELPNRAAVDRLAELKLDDRDRISRLQLGGTLRLYGFREGARFYAIWWDPDHKVWPSVKKHT